MAKWFIMPDDTPLDVLPPDFDGDAIRVRPLSRLERIEIGQTVAGIDELTIANLPVSTIRSAATMAIMDWTLKAADGSKLPLSEIPYLDDCIDFALARVWEMTKRPNPEGSENNS